MKILMVHTGGTIGSAFSVEKGAREQNAETLDKAKSYLQLAFEKSNSEYIGHVQIIDSKFPCTSTTLSESMTLSKISEIVRHIKNQTAQGGKYDGVVVLHGTDTLAYTASLFAFIFAQTELPIFLISGNRPPNDPSSNATANFIAAVNLICDGIAPNVYVTYRNSDNKMRLYLASGIMQSPNFSEDFFCGSEHKVFELGEESNDKIFISCAQYSRNRAVCPETDISSFQELSERVLLIRPYTGLDYSMFKSCFRKNAKRKYLGVVHGSYHSGTVSYPGLVLAEQASNYRKAGDTKSADKYDKRANAQSELPQSILFLSRLCEDNGAPLYIAPSALGNNQYETMTAVDENTCAVLLNMTTEAAYAKLTVALSYGMTSEQITEYMKKPINNEFNS